MSDVWWRQAVVYQIYPRSFADGTGDGIGDLTGILSRVPYLAALGIDAIWLSPFYPSALADGGYDVDDYRDIDPRIGTLEQFDELVARLHEVGIKVVIDLVPNHSSDRHAAFVAALAAQPGSPERDMYLFRNGLGAHGELPPADWRSAMGEPAWTQVADGQWYLHLFTREQPDWNWANPAVHAEFERTLRFWGDRGVDGFRVDVANALTKRLDAELPTQAELDDLDAFPVGDHPLWDRDEVQDVYAEWRVVFDTYDPPLMAVAEAWVDPERRARYTSGKGLDQAFNFDLLRSPWDAGKFRTVIRRNLELAAATGAPSTWVLSNHDVVRHATRYGLVGEGDENDWLLSGCTSPVEDRALGLARARAATMLMLALPGSSYLYQGEELGLAEVGDLRADDRQDPVFHRKGGAEIGRDGCRVPLPWTTSGPSFGFGDAAPHMPQPAWFADLAVSRQDGDAASTLWLYRRALHLRRTLQCAEQLEWLDSPDDVVAFARPGGWVSITNFGTEPASLPAGRILLTSDGAGDDAPSRGPGSVGLNSGEAGTLGPNTTAWLASEAGAHAPGGATS